MGKLPKIQNTRILAFLALLLISSSFATLHSVIGSLRVLYSKNLAYRSPYILQGVKMTIPYRICIGDHLSSRERRIVNRKVEEVFHKIDNVFNNWNPASEVSRFNRATANQPITLSCELFSFLERVSKITEETQGRFDPTLGSLKTLWLNHLKRGAIPSEKEILETRKACGLHTIILAPHKNQAIKTQEKTSLDLCGIIKGFAVDELITGLKQLGISSAYVEWGGEIKTTGKHPSGRDWKIIAVASPTSLTLSENAVASSGNYFQSWSVEGKTYTHILNSQTLTPLEESINPITAVSVVHSSCAYADAMATTLMTFANKDEAKKWAKEKGLEAYILD